MSYKKIIKQTLNDHKDFLLYGFINAITILLHLLLTIIIIRKISISDYGLYSLIMSVASLLVLIGISPSSSAIIYIGIEKRSDCFNQTISSRIIIVLLFSLLISIFLIIYKIPIINYLNIKNINVLIVYYLISFFITTITNYLLAINKQIMLSLLEVIANLIYLVLLIYSKLNPVKIIYLNIFSQSIILIGYLYLKNFKFNFNIGNFKNVLKFTCAHFLGFLGGYIINYGGNIIINHHFTTSEVGIYNLAARLFLNFSNIILLINTFNAANIVKMIKNNNKEEIYHLFYKTRKVIILLFSILIIFSIIFGKFIINFLFGSEYNESINIFIILQIANIPLILEAFYISLYNSLGKFFLLQIIIILQALLALLFMLILVPQYKYLGVVMPIVLVYFLRSVFSYFYLEPKIVYIINN